MGAESSHRSKMCKLNKRNDGRRIDPCIKTKKEKYSFPKGYIPWNKGLTKEKDKRLVRTEHYIKSVTGSGNPFYGKKHTLESRAKIKNNHADISGVNHPFYGKHIWAEKEHPRGMLGKNGYWLGKHRDQETKNKLKEKLTGRTHSEAQKKKQSLSHKLNWKKPEFVEKWKIGMKNYRETIVYPNTPELTLLKIIRKNNLPFDYVGDGKVWINKFNPDFLNRKERLIIEVFGDYWHNREDVKIRDIERINNYFKYGYKLLIIWEHELVKINFKNRGILTEEQIIQKIKDKNGYYYIPECMKND
mgnify:FL=1